MIPPAIFNKGTFSILLTIPSMTGLPSAFQEKGDYLEMFSYIAPRKIHHHIAFPRRRTSSFSNFPKPFRKLFSSSRFRNSMAAYSILNPNNQGHQLRFAFFSPRVRTHRCMINAYNSGRRIYRTSAYHDRPFNRGRSCAAGLISSTVKTLEIKYEVIPSPPANGEGLAVDERLGRVNPVRGRV
jgi:hypothetical protein